MTDAEPFDSAFVAVRYLLGHRTALLSGLGTASARAHRAVERLSSTDRGVRAASLAAEVARIVAALDARRLE
jgi:hypothetical protein